ncbi:MAG: helix-turn-helix transcriptional regulator [Deinococcota bacterium]
MTTTFTDYLQKFTPAERAEIRQETQGLVTEYALLRQLRKDNGLTQQELADLMEIRQASLSKLEHQQDILVSTLQRYVEALGGSLEIRATFADGTVTIQQFDRATHTPQS